MTCEHAREANAPAGAGGGGGAASLRTTLAARLAIVLLAACSLARCSHAPLATSDGAPSALPPRPATAQVLGAFPSTAAPPAPSFWRRLAAAVVGEGGPGLEPLPLERPFGVAAVPGGFLVADPDRRAVLRVDWRSGHASAVGCPALPWVAPIAVAASPDGTVYVADGDRVVRVGASGCTEMGRGALERPTGLALAGDRLFVVDPPRHAIVAFDAAGVEALRFGSLGDAEGDLNFPTALAAQADGTILVVDALHFRVARFSPEGSFLGAFGRPGDVVGDFARPKAVAVDADGGVYVSDAQHDAVLAFGPGGDFRFAIGESGSGAGQLLMPAGVALDGALLYVADAFNHRVVVFELQGDGAHPTGAARQTGRP